MRRVYIAMLGVIAGRQGDRQRALEIYQDIEAHPWDGHDHQTASWLARIAASLGELDKATALLRESVDKGWPVVRIHFQSSLLSQLRVMRDHPPFQELIRPKG